MVTAFRHESPQTYLHFATSMGDFVNVCSRICELCLCHLLDLILKECFYFHNYEKRRRCSGRYISNIRNTQKTKKSATVAESHASLPPKGSGFGAWVGRNIYKRPTIFFLVCLGVICSYLCVCPLHLRYSISLVHTCVCVIIHREHPR